MNKTQTEAALQLTAELAPLAAHIGSHNIARLIQKLASNARALHRRFEAECSHQWADTDKFRKGTESLIARTERAFEDLNIPPRKASLRINRDPRGWPLVFTIEGREHRLG